MKTVIIRDAGAEIRSQQRQAASKTGLRWTGGKNQDAVSSLVSTTADLSLVPRCLWGGCCLWSALCPQRPISSTWTALATSPRIILTTFIVTFGRGSVNPTKTMPHSRVRRWNESDASVVKWWHLLFLCPACVLHHSANEPLTPCNVLVLACLCPGIAIAL